jgi:hypothetical protein
VVGIREHEQSLERIGQRMLGVYPCHILGCATGVQLTSRWFRLATAKRRCSRHSGGVSCMNRTGVAILSVISLVVVAGCTTAGLRNYRGDCEPQQKRDWTLGNVDRTTAATLRPLSEAHATGGPFDFGFYPVESWFSSRDGSVLLCRSNGPLRRASAGEWWVFHRRGDDWKVEDSDCWGCVLVTS